MRSQFYLFLGFLLLAIVLPAKADPTGILSVNATAGTPSPQSAFVGEKITNSLDASTTAPSPFDENSIIGTPTWSWSVDHIYSRAIVSDPWTDGSANVSITQIDSTVAAATMVTICGTPAFYKIRLIASVTYSDNEGHTWVGSGSVNVMLVAGTWVADPPDSINPNPATGGRDDFNTTSGFLQNYMFDIWQCGPTWCKACCWGQDDGMGSGTLSKSSGPGTWSTKLKWVPVGSAPVNTNFTWTGTGETDYQWDIDVNSGWFGSGFATVKGDAAVSVTAAPGTAPAIANSYSFKVNKTQGSTAWAVSISLPAGVGVTPTPSVTSWSSGGLISITTPPLAGSITAASAPSVTASLKADASILWGSSAEGPQDAMGQATLGGLSIAINAFNPRGP